MPLRPPEDPPRKVVYHVFYKPSTGFVYAQKVEHDVRSRKHPYMVNPSVTLEMYDLEISRSMWSRAAKMLQSRYGKTGQRVEKAAFEWVKSRVQGEKTKTPML